jgi:hypothetical protein
MMSLACFLTGLILGAFYPRIFARIKDINWEWLVDDFDRNIRH